MFIIVEGPDGAGKSTAIEELSMELWRQGRGCVLINPKRSPNQSAAVEYMVKLDWYKPGKGVDLILDRSWYSEDIYGPIWRGESSVSPQQRVNLEAWALKKGAVVVLLDEHDKTLVERVCGRDDDEDAKHMDPRRVVEYAWHYRQQAPDWRLPKVKFPVGFDFQAGPAIRHAEVYERLALDLLEETK